MLAPLAQQGEFEFKAAAAALEKAYKEFLKETSRKP